MTITISDIAKHVGVTMATVSKVLNKSSSGYTISEKTREKIYSAVKELNYRPNYLSRALVGGKSMTIGLVINPFMFSNPVQTLRINMIEHEAKKHGYLTYIVGNSHMDQIDHIQNLMDRRVDGMIMYFTSPLGREVQDFINHQTVPTVYLDWVPEGYRQSVYVNRGLGIRQAAEHLAKLGHRRVQYFLTAHDQHFPESKVNPYREAFREFGIEMIIDPQLLIVGDQIGRETKDVVNRLIARGPLPTALLTSNDLVAQSVISTLMDAGIKVPDQVSVVGFDDMSFAELVRPALTTIVQPVTETSQAFEMLRELMNDPTREVETAYIDCTLVARQSTGPAPKS